MTRMAKFMMPYLIYKLEIEPKSLLLLVELKAQLGSKAVDIDLGHDEVLTMPSAWGDDGWGVQSNLYKPSFPREPLKTP